MHAITLVTADWYGSDSSWLISQIACVASVSTRGTSRKLGQEQKKNESALNFRAITRLETLATQAISQIKIIETIMFSRNYEDQIRH